MPTLPPKVLQGKVKWAHLYRADNYGKWSLNLYPTPESLQIFKDMKLLNHLKQDDDGYYFKLTRPVERESWDGRKKGFSAPLVVDKEGVPTTVGIGNGSDVKVELEHYSWTDRISKTTKYGSRITKVKIINLVPFSNADRTMEEIESEQRMEATDPSLQF